jgi:hypothetical protein
MLKNHGRLEQEPEKGFEAARARGLMRRVGQRRKFESMTKVESLLRLDKYTFKGTHA